MFEQVATSDYFQLAILIRYVRRFVRFSLGSYFWLHPMFSFATWHLPLAAAATYHRVTPVIGILLFVSYYTIVTEGGWLSVAADLLYIYFWPLILVWLLLKYCSMKTFRVLQRLVSPKDTSKADKAVMVATLQADGDGAIKPKLIYSVLRPFSQFVLLWCLLVPQTQNRILIVVALCVLVVGAGRVIKSLSGFLSNSGSWLNQFKEAFAKQLDSRIEAVLNYHLSGDQKLAQEAAMVLKVYGFCFRYMSEKRERIASLTLAASVLITIPLYLYLSLIFTSMYVGLATLNHIYWPWTDALTTSIFIPFAFTDLPHNVWIRLLGGLQAVVITLLGYAILFQRLRSSVLQVSDIATELRAILLRTDVQAALAIVEQASKRSSEASTTVSPVN